MDTINARASIAPDTDVLRFVTAGSVDDGKSTLIGRLLLDSKAVFADQLKAISGSRFSRAPGRALDLALLTDGLEAEREQGITIDVAYRYFATPRRKFIVADAPGHEQYTRNMVTGASTADAAVLLIDAQRVADGHLLAQTRRHATVARLFALRHLVIVVNKMDQVKWSRTVFTRILTACQHLVRQLGLPALRCIPVSALTGDNVVRPSSNMRWYDGPALLPLLESLPLDEPVAPEAPRFFVQWVIRHGGSTRRAFRGYAGQLQGGTWRAGDRIQVWPSGEAAQIRALRLGDEVLEAARPGDSVTLVLDRDIDVSRGDLITDARSRPVLSREFQADLCWLDRQALSPTRRYWLKQGSRLTQARIVEVMTRRDIEELKAGLWRGTLGLNDIGRVRIRTRDTLVLDDYDRQRTTGAFILIDDAGHQTVAAGMVRLADPADPAVAPAA